MAEKTRKTPRPTPAWLKSAASLGLGLAIGLVVVAIVYVPRAGWTSSDVTTGKHAGYPDLVPHRYDMPVDQATRVAAQVASRIPNWRVVHLDAPAGEMQAEARAFLFPIADDVIIKVRPAGRNSQSSEVLIRSHSRFGSTDFGANARHIRALQAAMDDKLPRLP